MHLTLARKPFWQNAGIATLSLLILAGGNLLPVRALSQTESGVEGEWLPGTNRATEITEVDFGRPSARSVLEFGWGNDEISDEASGNVPYVWSAGDASSLALFRETARDTRVFLNARPAPFPNLEAQRIEILVNGRALTQWEMVRGQNEFDFLIPSDYLSTGMNALTFRYRWSQSPAELGLAGDQRELAVQWVFARFMDTKNEDVQETAVPERAKKGQPGLKSEAGQMPTRPRIIILISLDTFRFDHLGKTIRSGGKEISLTPSLDEFVGDAVSFSQASTPMPFTVAAHMTMLTGIHPLSHGVFTQESALSTQIPTLPEILRNDGYQTVGIYSSEWLHPDFGFDRGFDEYDPVGGLTYAETIRASALASLDKASRSNQPIFLFLHFYDAHSDDGLEGNRLPYFAKPEFRRVEDRDATQICVQSACATHALLKMDREKQELQADLVSRIASLYAAGIRQLDAELGRLFMALKKMGLYDDALIIVTSDHGEQFREHGEFLHESVYQETIQIPLIVKFPGSQHAGEERAQIATLSDITPTILKVAELPAPPYLEGRNLAGSNGTTRNPGQSRTPTDTEAQIPRFAWSSRQNQGEYAIQNGTHKLIISVPEGEQVGFFDLATDPSEKQDQTGKQLPENASLKKQLEDALSQSEATAARFPAQSAPAAIDPSTREKLRALGYFE